MAYQRSKANVASTLPELKQQIAEASSHAQKKAISPAVQRVIDARIRQISEGKRKADSATSISKFSAVQETVPVPFPAPVITVITAEKKIAKRLRIPKRDRKSGPVALPTDELTGRLASVFANARRRGYNGTPNQWLRRGRTPRKCPEWCKSITVFDSNPLLCYRSWTGRVPWGAITPHQNQLVKSSGLPILRRRRNNILAKWNIANTRPDRSEIREPFSSPTLFEFVRQASTVGFSPIRRDLPVPTAQVDPSKVTSISANYIIGIRNDVTVPAKLLKEFKHHHSGFLIPIWYSVPVSSFLMREWRRNPSNLWLKYGFWGARETLSQIQRSRAGPREQT
jgi:hypothetical protein